jgi:hypothetical protein
MKQVGITHIFGSCPGPDVPLASTASPRQTLAAAKRSAIARNRARAGGVKSPGSAAPRLTRGDGAAKLWRDLLVAQRQEDVAVIFRTRTWVAAAVGLCLAQSTFGLAGEPINKEPPRLGFPAAQALPVLSPNQKLADDIAEQLRQSALLRHYTVDVAVRAGVVELSGTVADPSQREEVLRLVRGVPGVDKVVDRLTAAEAIQRVQAEDKPLEPGKLPPPIPQPGVKGVPTEPLPMFMAPPPSPYDMNVPKMPPYAWPTYAPYNNYSRVAYPEAYPYNAWPFIGPCYPFPKVPTGWRSVKLEFEDGYWFYSRTANKYDWWKLRFY